MKIGDLARETGVSRRLLRYYEEQGLLRPRRLPNGYREYAETDVAGVRHIRAMLAAGLPTAVIARLLDCVHDDDSERMVPTGCPGMITDLRHEQQRIAAEIDRLRTSQEALDSMITSALRDNADPRSEPASNRLRGENSLRS